MFNGNLSNCKLAPFSESYLQVDRVDTGETAEIERNWSDKTQSRVKKPIVFPGEASANLLFFFIQLRIINSEYRVPLPRNYNKRCPNQKHIGYTVAYMSVYLVCGRAQYLLLLMMPRSCPTIKSSASCTDHQLAGDLTLIAKHSNYRPSVWLLRFICLNTF